MQSGSWHLAGERYIVNRVAKWFTTLAVVLGTAAVWFAVRQSQSENEIPAAAARRGDLQVVINTLGRIEAARSRSIIQNLPGDKGKIVWIIDDGTVVKPGDLLVQFDKTPFEEMVRTLVSKLDTQQSVKEALVQAAAWEESQAEREIRSLEFDLQVARMDAEQLEKGDGPLEMAQRKDELNEAQRRYDETSGYVKDLEKLLQQGLIDETELRKAREELQATSLKLEVVDQKFESYSKYVFPAKLRMAQAKKGRCKLALEEMMKASGFRIGQAKAKAEEARRLENHYRTELKKARRLLADTAIIAPESGLAVLVERHFEGKVRKPRIGDVAWQGQPLMYLPDLSEMIIQSHVRELDLHKVHQDMPVEATFDAFPDLRLPGTIRRIGIIAQKREGRRGMDKVFSITVKLGAHDQRLRPGMNARVKIISATRNDVVTVPLTAVFGVTGQQWCYLRNGENWRKQTIRVGVIGHHEAEILDGLSDGQLVALVEPGLN